MDDTLALYREKVTALFPELIIRSIEVNREGLANDAVLINGELIVRFAKNEYGVRALAQELRVLDWIRPHLTLPIPTPHYRDQEAIAYPLIHGIGLSREQFPQLDGATQQRLAEQLGAFLHELHQVPTDAGLPTTLAPTGYEDWENKRARIAAKVYPLLLKHQISWAEALFDQMMADRANFDYRPRLIHGDLASYHILFDPAAKRLGGIIDFGVAGLGDPATDLGNLLQYYGESFLGKMAGSYSQLDAYLPRARFYAQSIELDWVLLGLESGEDFWFTGHIGAARDLGVTASDRLGRL